MNKGLDKIKVTIYYTYTYYWVYTHTAYINTWIQGMLVDWYTYWLLVYKATFLRLALLVGLIYYFLWLQGCDIWYMCKSAWVGGVWVHGYWEFFFR